MKQTALVGNPNCGKTTLFNSITGSYEYVGNWPGVTVEKKVGVLSGVSEEQIIDLPGLYSINPVSADEAVVTNCLLEVPVDGILNIVDAAQLNRSLYVTLQLLELQKPMLIALNMIDVARNRGIKVDAVKLAEQLNIPVTPIIARSGEGCNDVKTEITRLGGETKPSFFIDYGPLVEPMILQIEKIVGDEHTVPARWIAIQYLEGNAAVESWLTVRGLLDQLNGHRITLEEQIIEIQSVKSLSQYFRMVRSVLISDMVQVVEQRVNARMVTRTQQLDRIVTHPLLGAPVFLIFMFLIFKVTFDWVGTPLSDVLSIWLDQDVSPWMNQFLISQGASDFIIAVITNGIISGVGGVLVFVPQIFLLFMMISFIEDSGYMARVAFVMDRIMQLFGLNGKAFIPMIIGFGCNVPGVMAARTIEQPRERLFTILLTPLMSCSARLPVYSLFAGTFFAANQSMVVFSLYLLGIIVALVLAKVFSLFAGVSGTGMFFIELPPYRVPQWKTLWRSTWEKGKGFVRKAGTFIFGGSVLIWLLSYLGPTGAHVQMNESLLAIIGGWIAPVFAPIGFGTWQAGVALITGFLAKEVVVSTMNIIYAAPDAGTLATAIGQAFTPLSAYSFMVFVLLYVPCLATVAVIRKETGSTKWTWFSVGYALVIAYILALVVYQGGKLLGFGV